jgi:hypothetical protein
MIMGMMLKITAYKVYLVAVRSSKVTTVPPNAVAAWLALLYRIREVPGTNLNLGVCQRDLLVIPHKPPS